jgi:SpoVK/Ycf46/Vps4 family AAA+-type ATPase
MNTESTQVTQTLASKIIFIQSKNKSNTDSTFDAINNYIGSLDTCKELKFIDYYYIDNTEPFKITDKIYCKASKLEQNKENVHSYSLELYSYTLQLAELKKFIQTLKKQYLYERNNKLDNLKFYFDEHHVPLMRNANQSIKYSTALNELSFTMTQFNTNKSLSNVFGTHLNVVKERMDLFCNNIDWYTEKGIPHTLGILLHGPPGTGKTSLIKAIAKDTNRHIFNIRLYPDTTKTQLHNLFFNESVKVLKNGSTETYNIPLNERLYVMEDVDCDNELLLDRRYKKIIEEESVNDFTHHTNSFEHRYEDFFPGRSAYSNIIPPTSTTSTSNPPLNEPSKHEIEEDTSEKITLSFILNILDGILETPGRILIMTSNYPEKLDSALLRPGRIDINLEVGYCDKYMIKEMFAFFYKKNINLDDIDTIQDITPAQLNKILLDNFNNSDKATEEIKEYINKQITVSTESTESTSSNQSPPHSQYTPV